MGVAPPGTLSQKKQSHIFFRNLGPTPRSVPNWNYGKVHAHRSAHARARQRDHAHDTAGASGTFCAHRQFCSIYFNKIFFQKIVTWVCLCTTTHPWPSVYPTVVQTIALFQQNRNSYGKRPTNYQKRELNFAFFENNESSVG
jgi:hypothetical protein